MKLRLLLPLLALPAFAVTGLAQNTESAVQLRRDFTTVQQQRDALSEQVAQLQQQLETLQAEREAVKAEQAAMHEKVAAADTRAVEATEALRAQKEAEMTVDMTVRAYAIKEQEALDAAKAAAIAADKQAAAERERESAVAEALRLTAERDAAKQSEATALAARSSVPYIPPAALRPTPVATEEPVATAPAADTAQPPAAASAAPAGPRTHTVAEGESLSLIAYKYYQSPNKWDRIVAANRTKLKNPDMLRPGMVLIIP